MKIRWLLGMIFLSLIAIGCGSERDKGINRDKDRPVAADASKKK
jgi:hypothetical protein